VDFVCFEEVHEDLEVTLRPSSSGGSPTSCRRLKNQKKVGFCSIAPHFFQISISVARYISVSGQAILHFFYLNGFRRKKRVILVFSILRNPTVLRTSLFSKQQYLLKPNTSKYIKLQKFYKP
jgi:hypothetical protein